MMIGDIAHRLKYAEIKAEIKKDRAEMDAALNYTFDYIQNSVGFGVSRYTAKAIFDRAYLENYRYGWASVAAEIDDLCTFVRYILSKESKLIFKENDQ